MILHLRLPSPLSPLLTSLLAVDEPYQPRLRSTFRRSIATTEPRRFSWPRDIPCGDYEALLKSSFLTYLRTEFGLRRCITDVFDFTSKLLLPDLSQSLLAIPAEIRRMRSMQQVHYSPPLAAITDQPMRRYRHHLS
jgi:hypothetical protein